MSNIVCSPCLRNDKTSDCVKYCLVCNENLCRGCFREHVKKYSTSQQHHRLIGRDELPDWLIGGRTSTEERSKCSVHPENDLDTLCMEHDSVCCGACAVTVHKFCNNVIDLDEVESIKERDGVIADCDSTLLSLESLMTQRKENQSRLRLTTSESLKDLAKFRKKVNQMFDTLERDMVEDIDTRCIDLDNQIEKDKSDLEKAIKLLEIARKELKTTDVTSSSQTSIKNANARQLLKTSKALQENVEARSKSEEVHFNVNVSLENYISELKCIGYCSEKPLRTSIPINKIIEKELRPDNGEQLDFVDAMVTPSGDTLLLDANTKAIVKLDDSYDVVQTYSLQNTDDSEHYIGEPYAMCCIDKNEIAVSMVRDKLIKLFVIRSEIEKQRDIDVGEYCRGIAYNRNDEELYVACGGGSFTNEGLGHIRVYNIQGEQVRIFKHGGNTRTPLANQPLHLAMSPDCSMIYVTECMKGVVFIDTQGTIMSQYVTAELDGACGICIDMNGDLIVTGYRSNNVVCIDKTLTSHKTVCSLEENASIGDLHAICYDSKRHVCIVSTSRPNCLFIIHL